MVWYAVDNIVEVCKELDAGANIDAVNVHGCTALHLAAMRDYYGTATLLINRQADVNVMCHAGRTPLQIAVEERHVCIVKLLLENGARIDGEVLFTSCWDDDADMTKLLIDHGADVNFRRVNGETVLRMASWWQRVNSIPLLLAAGADVNEADALRNAVRKNSVELTRLFLHHGAYVDRTDNDKFTALHLAAFIGNIEIVYELLKAGANIKHKNILGETALHTAVHRSHVDVVRLLLIGGLVPGVHDLAKRTVLLANRPASNVHDLKKRRSAETLQIIEEYIMQCKIAFLFATKARVIVPTKTHYFSASHFDVNTIGVIFAFFE